jgi:GTP-binding protein
VKVDAYRSFVVADIPGLIEGASDGAGLGIRFLKHLTRNRILLHLVDVAPFDESDPAEQALSIVRELERFSPTLAARPRWLVLNKIDLVDEETLAERREAILSALDWTGPVYEISAISGRETDRMSGDLMTAIEYLNEQEAEDEELKLREQDVQMQMQSEARERIESLRLEKKAARMAQAADSDEDDDFDDSDVEVEYRS